MRCLISTTSFHLYSHCEDVRRIDKWCRLHIAAHEMLHAILAGWPLSRKAGSKAGVGALDFANNANTSPSLRSILPLGA
jgi:hypothetical protein